ncbi:hypothetical protein Adeg_0848 [Ammonifex degensii KC4]|uniref:DivIVA domain-containing protein n=1 Tax=Ammonifex degensii (strain DSM 10501 / KC4) TaxID=429009 RepID=C9RCL1_AMMDK|nr:DivIVA domain-containing protein [Ammonifex degensii]ACX51988.1 hypothetical protein Adeg_0848 [Ammonifex degensii KC4]
MAEDKDLELESIRFRRSLFGYSPKEVDELLEKVALHLRQLKQQKKHLEQLVAGYQAQEENLRAALLRAEETVRRAKEQAIEEAARLRAEAQAEVKRMLAEARKEWLKVEEERNKYQRMLKEKVGIYEREAQVLLDRFYVVVRRHLKLMEEEFSQEVKGVLERFERELRELPAPAIVLEVESSEVQEAAATREKKDSGEEVADLPLVLGRVLKEDLRDETGKVVVAAGEVVTPEVIERAIAHGLYGELIAKLAEEEE